LGANGAGIPIGKLALYCAAGKKEGREEGWEGGGEGGKGLLQLAAWGEGGKGLLQLAASSWPWDM